MTQRLSNSEYQITTHCADETRRLGKTIGAALTAGTILALYGDLGSGKTSFVQGLARGLNVPDEYYITSPSYTLINEYPGRLPLFHIDLYRITNSVDIEDIGLYEILDDDAVMAIEWADRMAKDTPQNHLRVRFEIIDDKTRKISIIPQGVQAIEDFRKWNLGEEMMRISASHRLASGP
ncbi:MAG: tRNA (adenosine(37)-N6)-threonylcarbamoyltransferase complex ATPase subunit type 1 TsaE [Desulfobacterales bacterium]